jgi:hypothetical protein
MMDLPYETKWDRSGQPYWRRNSMRGTSGEASRESSRICRPGRLAGSTLRTLQDAAASCCYLANIQRQHQRLESRVVHAWRFFDAHPHVHDTIFESTAAAAAVQVALSSSWAPVTTSRQQQTQQSSLPQPTQVQQHTPSSRRLKSTGQAKRTRNC